MNNADVIAKIDKALATVSALCEGEIRWTMRVPAEPENDPDLIIAGALQAAKEALAAAAPVAEPAGWRDFLVQLSHAEGGMVNGNQLSRAAKELLNAAPVAAPDDGD